MNESGMYIDRSREDQGQTLEIPPEGLPKYLDKRIWFKNEVTDVFVWVHGWKNDYESAIETAQKFFNGIVHLWKKQAPRYKNIRTFEPGFVAIHWPSMSSSTPGGYSKIRDRAHSLTQGGCAEYVLASLLGYLEKERMTAPRPADIGMLKAGAGYYVHCIGHSFGGRFLGQAITAAAEPSYETLSLLGQTTGAHDTLSLLESGEGFDFTVDSLLVFQMAAPNEIFRDRFNVLLQKAPLSGPICLTFSNIDRANCFFHEQIEGRKAIGCTGAIAPSGKIKGITLNEVNTDYVESEFFSQPIVNVDASWAYNRDPIFSLSGAHSDFWYEESIHLLLSVVNAVRNM